MTWFSLPAVRTVTTGAAPRFIDPDACNAWLASQPLANAPQMQGELAAALESINSYAIPPRQRYKILEALRKAIVAVETESSKRYEYRPLPLAAVEQQVLDASCRLWRQLATGYLHCLRACLDGDPEVVEHSAKIAHRVMSTLRLEQICRYRGGAEVPGNWWRLLHATLAAAEQLQASMTAVSDRLFAETRESTSSGQYAMAVLLHLCRPHELSRSQFSATLRWLARWRELAAINDDAEAARYARHVMIDLSSDQPVHLGPNGPGMARWIALDGVLGKFKSRLKGLREGQSPEDLKLGSGMPAEACIGLLQFLHGALQNPPAPPPEARSDARLVGVCTSLERIHQLLGGKPISTPDEPSAISNRRVHEQIAIFGHAGRADDSAAKTPLEQWQLLAESPTDLTLLRGPGSGEERLGSRCLIAVQLKTGETPVLAVVRSLRMLENGALLATARVQPGSGQAMLAVGREKGTNRVVHHPSVFVPAIPKLDLAASLFVGSGVMSKLMRLDVADLPDGLKPGRTMDRGSNYERLYCE